MTEPLIGLNEFCHARLGAIGSFVASDLDKWVMALLITVRASWALQDNLWTFLNEYPFPDTRIYHSLSCAFFTVSLTQISCRNCQAVPNGNGLRNGISRQLLHPGN